MTFKEREKLAGKLVRKTDDEIVSRLQKIHTNQLSETGVCSFAGDPRSILMWSHYAASHTGICIQFERARHYDLFAGALPVEYSQDYPGVNWIKYVESDFINVLLRKYIGWEYEKEHRLIDVTGANRSFEFRPEALTAVLLGCQASRSVKSLVRETLRERASAEMPAVKVYQVVKAQKKYSLVIHSAQES